MEVTLRDGSSTFAEPLFHAVGHIFSSRTTRFKSLIRLKTWNQIKFVCFRSGARVLGAFDSYQIYFEFSRLGKLYYDWGRPISEAWKAISQCLSGKYKILVFPLFLNPQWSNGTDIFSTETWWKGATSEDSRVWLEDKNIHTWVRKFFSLYLHF